MNKRSEKALHKIQENDPTLTELNIGRGGGIFQGATDSDFSTLGEAIKNNTNITKLAFGIDGRLALDDTNSAFYNNLKQNSSIDQLTFRCYNNSIVGVGGAVLQAFQANTILLNWKSIMPLYMMKECNYSPKHSGDVQISR